MKMLFNYFRINAGRLSFIAVAFFLLTACTSKSTTSEQSETNTNKEMSTPNANDKSDLGATKISELLDTKEKYNGQTVRVSGKSVKVNNNIMDRNWIHIQDDSVNGEKDLTVTTTDNVSVGDMVVFEGVITLNKDFGSGYKYDIIMENARLVK